jgi:hypothetical protein
LRHNTIVGGKVATPGVVDNEQQPRVDAVGQPAGEHRPGHVQNADGREQARSDGGRHAMVVGRGNEVHSDQPVSGHPADGKLAPSSQKTGTRAPIRRPVDQVARLSGLGSGGNLRQHLRRGAGDAAVELSHGIPRGLVARVRLAANRQLAPMSREYDDAHV